MDNQIDNQIIENGWREGIMAVRRRWVPLRHGSGLLLLAGFLFASVSWENAPAQVPPVEVGSEAAAPQPEQIAQWVRDLEGDRFVVRRSATDALVRAGKAAVEPLVAAMAKGGPEILTRGIYILKSLAASRDPSTEEAAVAALHQLSTSGTSTTARLANEAITALGAVRQERAIQELKELGARVKDNDNVVFVPSFEMIGLEIGPNWFGSAADLDRFRWLPDVREVVFIGPQVNDEWVKRVEYLTGVERVIIKHGRITDDSVRSLAKLKQLTQIYLMYTPVTDSALAELHGLDTLRELRLYGTAVTPLAVEQFRAESTNVQVDYKAGAFLGVMCQQPPAPCQVFQVVPDSAAARGGLEVRDIIVRYGGNPVTNFDELRTLIGKNKVGDSVLIQVARGLPVTGQLEQRGNRDLGMEVEAAAYGVKIVKLAERSAGLVAGLQVGDILLDLNGEPIMTAERLVQAYAAIGAEEYVEFNAVRNTRLVSARVTFGEWSELER
jgi:hypothetical protein